MKYKIKMQTFQNIDYASIQRYLAMMAEKGWIIQYAGAWLLFKKHEPTHVQFHVETFFDQRNEREYFDVCEKSGWKLLYHNQKSRIFMAHAKQEVIPLQTDDELLWEQIQEHAVFHYQPYMFILTMISFYILFLCVKTPWMYATFLPLFSSLICAWLWLFVQLYRHRNFIQHCRMQVKQHEKLYTPSYTTWCRLQTLHQFLLYINILFFICILFILPYPVIACLSLLNALIPIFILGLVGICFMHYVKLFQKRMLYILVGIGCGFVAYIGSTSYRIPLLNTTAQIHAIEPLLETIDTKYQAQTKEVLYNSSFQTPIHAKIIYKDVLAPYGNSRTTNSFEVTYDQKKNEEDAQNLMDQLMRTQNGYTRVLAADGTPLFSAEGQEEGKKWNVDEAFLQDQKIILRKDQRVFQIIILSNELDTAYYLSQLQELFNDHVSL